MTPDAALLPSLKVPARVDAIHAWVDRHAPAADAMIVSAEMYLYGGLIASRISNETTAVIMARAERLMSYSTKYPSLSVYVSNVVMRIPSYNGDFEEPWYWADYGYDLYTYSFYLDKYSQSHDAADLNTAKEAVAAVPPSAAREFMWRRERNHNVTMSLLHQLNAPAPPFNYFYTTLDDSAEYGFNIREAAEIKNYIAQNSMPVDKFPVYPGADEVHLTILSKYCVNTVLELSAGATAVNLAAQFRDPSNVNTIPSYEGQPMIDTLEQQIKAAGGILTVIDSSDMSAADDFAAFLLVNNFSGEQQEASSQPTDEGSDEDYAMFDPIMEYASSSNPQHPIVVGFCDNRYANGGDIFFANYMAERTASFSFQWNAYAGWNTNGNTIGTVVANTIILSLFGESSQVANAAFNSLRLLEDVSYQASLRQDLSAYANAITNTGETSSNLSPDLDFYNRYAFKSLSARYDDIVKTYGLVSVLQSTYFPWNRTFEIGFILAE